jgi:gamma-butyrobetaine dioxygenase
MEHSVSGGARILTRPELLTVEWGDGSASQFASIWLRDNLPEDRDQRNSQRLVDVADLPAAPRIRDATLNSAEVSIRWQDENLTSSFPLAWLRQHCGVEASSPPPTARPWFNGQSLDARADFAWTPLSLIQASDGERHRWLKRLLQDGIAFLSGVPAVDGGILEAMSSIGRVAETNYGQVFDVRAVPQPENLAYTDLGLGLHTDNPYREPVPGFQALHTLIAAPEGGDSIFADGFALAEYLRQTAPEAFARLTRTAVPFHYRSKSADLYAERPLIQLTCEGAVSAVHYNNRSVAPLKLAAYECSLFYQAYRQFAGLLREPRFQAVTRLQSGDLVLFDNQRILHGRKAFASANHPRHLRGCYLTRDSVYSTAALLQGQYSNGAGG